MTSSVATRKRPKPRAAALETLARVHYAPIRHHSPRSSAIAQKVLDAAEPELVLVEGPKDANELIGALVDDATLPPIAILGYRTDRAVASTLWPFASYSAEYVALRWAKAHGAASAFIDLPIGRTLASSRQRFRTSHDPPLEASNAELDIHDLAAKAAGYRSFEAFWEASFEAPSYEIEAFRAAILAYAELSRQDDPDPFDRARDAFMAREIHEHAARVAPERIVVVAGAAHVAAFVAGDVDLALEKTLPKAVASASTIIPYSFPRLAEQLGYGAGNRAPEFYQRAHDDGGSLDRATLETLLSLAEHLRLRGFSASLADALEGYRLARGLADLRGKTAPGVDELRDAVIATLCRGDATHVDGFLWPFVVGKNVGRVAARVGRSSLEEEFWRTVREKMLPASDALEAFSLVLNNETEVETSIFLHRLRVVGVPYASFAGALRTGGGSLTDDAAGGFSALARAREKWEAQWTPATDVALVSAIVLGDSLEQAATRALVQRLGAAAKTADAADVLLEAIVAATAAAASDALEACERLAANDDDLPSLARGARALSTLVSYGTSRGKTKGGDEALRALLRKVFERAVLRAEAACAVADEAVAAANAALRALHDVALAQPAVDGALWIAAARRLAASLHVHPSVAGHAEGLLYLAQAASDDEVGLAVASRLGDALEPEAAARYLEGFLEANALALVKSRPVVAAVDAFLAGIDGARFTSVLPVLRRGFGHLGATERRYLLENLLALRRSPASGAEDAARLQKDKETLRAMQAELTRAMSDLDDLL